MADLFPCDDFLVQFPLYLIGKSDGKAIDFLLMREPDDEVSAVVFTDHAGAEEYLESIRGTIVGCSIMNIESPLAFIGLVFVLERKGITHVEIDSRKPGAVGRKFGIEEIRRFAVSWY